MEQQLVASRMHPMLELQQILQKVQEKHGLQGQLTIAVVPQHLLHDATQRLELPS